ncbi:MAG: hypothetical protein AB8B74_13475 [Crocinitomicaceae bacterium]
MKHFLIALGMSIGIMACSSSKIIGYTYTEGGMMGSTKMTITADSLTFLKTSRGQQTYEAFTSPETDWIDLQKMGKHIQYNGMDTLKSPTMGRATDAAPFAYMEIITADSVYQSASFDGGQPPIAIAALVIQLRNLSTSAKVKN